jgi:hypothetical protein
MFDVSKMQLERMVFEVRFDHAFLYWDNSGKIFNEILKNWPDATVESVTTQEARVIIKVKDEDLSLSFTPQLVNFDQHFPANIKAMGEFADYALPVIRKHLGVNIFSRVGNRFIYVYKVDDVQTSISLLKKTGFFNVPEDRLEKIGTSLKDPVIKFTVERGDDIGYIFNMAHLNRKLDIKVPKPVKYDDSAFVSKGLLVDVDFFTIKPVDAGNVRVHDLLKKNKKDIEYFIGDLLG